MVTMATQGAVVFPAHLSVPVSLTRAHVCTGRIKTTLLPAFLRQTAMDAAAPMVVNGHFHEEDPVCVQE